VIVGVASAALAWRQAQRAAAATGTDLTSLVASLRRVPAGERLTELHRRAEPGSWEHDLASEAVAAQSPDAQVGAVNLALSEADHALTHGADWPRSGIRIALLGAAFLAFAQYLFGSGELKWSLSIVAIGGVAALICVEAGRSARRSVLRQRRAIDDLVAVVFGDALRGEAPCHSPRDRRGRRHGRGRG
jgi:hypothetical protein